MPRGRTQFQRTWRRTVKVSSLVIFSSVWEQSFHWLCTGNNCEMFTTLCTIFRTAFSFLRMKTLLGAWGPCSIETHPHYKYYGPESRSYWRSFLMKQNASSLAAYLKPLLWQLRLALELAVFCSLNPFSQSHSAIPSFLLNLWFSLNRSANFFYHI